MMHAGGSWALGPWLVVPCTHRPVAVMTRIPNVSPAGSPIWPMAARSSLFAKIARADMPTSAMHLLSSSLSFDLGWSSQLFAFHFNYKFVSVPLLLGIYPASLVVSFLLLPYVLTLAADPA